MKKSFFLLSIVIIFIVSSKAQGYDKGKIYIGPTFTINNYLAESLNKGMGASLTCDYGIGLLIDNLSIGADIGIGTYRRQYYNASYYYGINWYKYSYTYMYFIPAFSYHIFKGKKSDPYLRVGAGLYYWKCKYLDEKGHKSEIGTLVPDHEKMEVNPSISAGIRYWVNDKYILRAETGYPYMLSIGIDFSFN